MALTLYVDSARWRAHQKQVQDQFPGMIPVCKGNGYGFGHERLCEEATRMGADVLAVGTTYEAARIKDWFSGDLLVLTPFRRGEEPVPLPDRVIRSVSSLEGVRSLVGARVVIECMSSMRRHGISEQDLGQLQGAIEDVRLEASPCTCRWTAPTARTPSRRSSAGWTGCARPGCRCTPCSSATCAPRS